MDLGERGEEGKDSWEEWTKKKLRSDVLYKRRILCKPKYTNQSNVLT